MEILSLPNVLCCLPQILLMLTILASLSAYGLQRIGDIVPTPNSFAQSVYQFVDGKPSTASSQCPTFSSAPLLILLQTVVLYLTSHSPATHATSIHYCYDSRLKVLSQETTLVLE